MFAYAALWPVLCGAAIDPASRKSPPRWPKTLAGLSVPSSNETVPALTPRHRLRPERRPVPAGLGSTWMLWRSTESRWAAVEHGSAEIRSRIRRMACNRALGFARANSFSYNGSDKTARRPGERLKTPPECSSAAHRASSAAKVKLAGIRDTPSLVKVARRVLLILAASRQLLSRCSAD